MAYAPLSALQLLTAEERFLDFRGCWLNDFVLIWSNCYLLNQD